MKTRVPSSGPGRSAWRSSGLQSAADKGADIPESSASRNSPTGAAVELHLAHRPRRHGDPVHGSMYRYLWSNGPKECLEFADYRSRTFRAADWLLPAARRAVDYIKGRVEKSGVKKWVRFNSPVRMVTFSDQTQKFTVTAHDRTSDVTYSEEFDYVVVALGHFLTPDAPYFDRFCDV